MSLAMPLLAAGCAGTPMSEPVAEPPARADATGSLPPGRGRSLLEAQCISCHDLGGLWAYKGYYNEARWRGLVETMIAHGAELNETETHQLVAYLVEHFGPDSP